MVNAEQLLRAGVQVLARTLMGTSGIKEDGWLQIKALAIIQLATGEGAPEAYVWLLTRRTVYLTPL